ncbi:MAG: phosphate ABC transporter substrate-binding protein [Alcanivorax sp.]|jgi:ABC-type phosphate transport system substrate-binding protein|uniref:phosphate ABC transporter substrate-binding protein n=1 Tax=unclassified Ketobacter TaxID=2639109 RepID=UPI000F215C8E|nr:MULTISPECIES: phosphate ABC transporter substrate-binding protein [unclassified Ketobacter]MEC8810999.1 phosphate ABC transporter substrate-binding protein [Pseudomonadota bacterium]TNC85406.1 MAG: phosphate ABC transporter substrate-binding protein [Alcanivorax sp.]MCK5790753.1 phosphate ABC transporter substrate-binding protein [Ketobacter sp.]RLT89033.1 MAG: phosphate ABC transporter substrate-binding protein [Ketobacter sp. GenoA1]RLT97173.1 MAG: phosphate ABC transporter substrate-bind
MLRQAGPIFTLLVALMLHAPPVFAEQYAVIVHPSNAADFDSNIIGRIFLTKQKTFSTGADAIPIELKHPSKSRQLFHQKIIKKSDAQIRSYWTMLLFSGKGTPPKEVPSEQKVLELVAGNPNMVGYVSAQAVNDQVKVVLRF